MFKLLKDSESSSNPSGEVNLYEANLIGERPEKNLLLGQG